MDIVNQLFSNSVIKNAAFGSLKKTMKQHNLSGIFVTYDEPKDDFNFQFMNAEQVIIPKAEFDEMKRVYLEYLNK
jgi:hypothetical protein